MGRLFSLGRIVATPGALRLVESGAFEPAELLGRHVCGDWGDLDTFDRRENERALRSGARIFSAYQTLQGRVWIITEATDDQGVRGSTCILLPEDYYWEGWRTMFEARQALRWQTTIRQELSPALSR